MAGYGVGISVDKVNEKMLKAADLLNSLDIGIEVMESTDAKVELTPFDVKVQSITCQLTFKEPLDDDKRK